MNVIVNQDACIGCGLCCDICPQVFKMNNEGKAVAHSKEAETNRGSVVEAKNSCPTDAISVNV